MSPSQDPSVSGQGGSGPRGKVTSLPQSDSSKVEVDARIEYAAEQGRLQEMKSYLRELTEAYDLPPALVEHPSDEESGTTLKTIDALFKDFASRLSKECRDKETNLQSTQAKLDMSTSAQATLEREKLALEEATKMKDAKLEELESIAKQAHESDIKDLRAQVESCATERDEATSELRELRQKLEEAESERNEKEISMQKLNYALEEARQSNRQAAPSVDVETLRTMISDLREELRGLNRDNADLERQAEITTAAQKQKDDEITAQMRHQDEYLLRMQTENEKDKRVIEALQHEKDEQLRKFSEAEAERQPVTFRVDNEILPREKYEKLLDNVRGDMAKMREQLQQAEEERDRAIEDFDGARKMVMEEFVPLYALAVDEAAHNMFNIWEAEEASLKALVGKGEYRRYLHAVVMPDRQPSQTSSEGFVARGETATGLGLDCSQASEPMSLSVRQNLADEFHELDRESSAGSECTLMGRGDGSAELFKMLDECRTRREEAEQRVEELEGETKKQQDEIQKLKEAAEVVKPSVDDSAKLQKALDECQIRREEADQRLKELEGETKKQKDEINKLQDEIQRLKEVAETGRKASAKLGETLDECQRQRNKADIRLEELDGETKKQKDKIKELQDEIHKLKEAAVTAETSKASGEEPDASECRAQTPTQDAAKRDEQRLQGASAVEPRDMQADLRECQAQRQQADMEIEVLKGEARRRSRELRKLKGELSLQQRIDELLKERLQAVQPKASKRKAKVRWAEARVMLQEEGAGDEGAIFSSTNDPEGYLKLVSALSQRVDEAESQFGRTHQQLADVRGTTTTLQATIEQLESQRGQLEQERQQLWENLKARRHSEEGTRQANAALEEGLENNEELGEMDGDMEEMDEVTRKTKEELEKKKEELEEKRKALDDCRAHDKKLEAELAALEARRDGESDGDDSQDEDLGKEIDRLEEKVADLQRQLSAANYKASKEAERRHEVEEKGVWEGTRAAALRSKQTELDNLRKEYDEEKKIYEWEIEDLATRLDNRVDADNAEVKRFRVWHKHVVDGLEARLKMAEDEGRGHASEMARIKFEHTQATEKLKAQLDVSDKIIAKLQDELYDVPHTEALLKKRPCDAGTQTNGGPHAEDMTPVAQVSHGPTGAYLKAYFTFKKSIESGLRLQDTATGLQNYQLRIVEKLDQELARRISLSRIARASETPTPNRPETLDSTTDDASRSSPPGDQVPDSPTTESSSDEEDERAATLRGIKETCEEFEVLRQRKQRFRDDEASAIQLVCALEAEIEALKKRLDGADDSDEKKTAEPDDGGEEPSDDESDNGEEDPKDPAAIRRRIARLRKKVSKTQTNLKKDEEALRSAIDEHEGELAEWIEDLDDLDDDPERTLYRYLANGTWHTAKAGYWKGTTWVHPLPLPSGEVIHALLKGMILQRERLRVDGFPELDSFIDNGDIEKRPRRQRPQEALVRRIQEKLGSLRSYAEACEKDLERISRVVEDSVPVDDPVPRVRARSRRPTLPSQSRTVTLDEGVEDGGGGGGGEYADRRDIVYDDAASEPTSVASGDLSGDDGNPNRMLKSVIPTTVHDALSHWKKTMDKMLEKTETLQSAVEGLIDAGVNSRDYDCVRSRVRRLRKDLAEAAATNADLRARLSKGSVEGTDSELQEMVRTLRHENSSLQERSRVADQAVRDRAAQEARQRQLEKDLIAARARAEVEKTKNRTLAGEKERLEKAVKLMEELKDKAIRDGLDREMRETVYNHEELMKEAAGLKKEAADLREKLSNELLTRSAPLETAQMVIEGMAGRLREADRRAEVAEDMRATLVTGIERALGIDAEDDARSLERMRRVISNMLCRGPEETDSQSGEGAGDEKKQKGEYERAMEEYSPNTGREHELVRKMVDERKKGAEALAAAKKAHEERTSRRHAEHERQVRDLQAMYEAAEKARKLCETNLTDALERIQVLEVEAGQLRRANGALDKRLEEECTANQEMSEKLYGPGYADGGGDADDDNSSDGEGSDDSDNTTRGGGRCACPCVGLCNAMENPIFDGLPAGAQDVVRNVKRVYRRYRSCCGKGGTGTGAGASSETAAGEVGDEDEDEDDGLLLWRLLGVMRGDVDIREQMRNEGRHYAARLGLAFWACARVHLLSWGQTAAWVHARCVLRGFFLPERRWKPGSPGRAPPPQRVATVVKDAGMMCVLYYTYQVLAATWAVQRVWEMANGYTRAYFVERALHPERSTWLGLGGVDMRLRGTAPYSAAVGEGAEWWWVGRS
ncbi:uncharacterized protein GLRG_02600 [Colletotrichum graminicola M1.001]|uniref:Uncharacterized protein n=1 Tax=Colletotrichum graminicola (strain M1.001 / M2 / FGSC 10212) TaxID=645133 RepID=E3Q7E2_COLGM|nr:uncharacterized protein GLRG_02600 [Colletotrichum graminicola M1.001]EFQ26780.1 hypothetical protein GLRG_02600 [Colletotrichum graminicola M1.001]